MPELSTNRLPRVAIVGCGLIGQKRAASLAGQAVVVICCDVNISRAETLSRQHHGSSVSSDWKAAVVASNVDVVFVCTSHDLLALIAEAAASHGKHVLIEKPGARRVAELDQVVQAASRTGALVRVGFNHR